MLTFRAKDFLALCLLAVYAVAFWVGPGAPKPIKVSPLTEEQIKKGIEDERTERKIRRAIATARMVYRENGCSQVYSDITGRTAYEFGLSPRVLAAVIYVESSCRADAKSSANSVGLTQINPRVWGREVNVLNPEQNVRLGAKILKMYINKYGLVEGLHAYNGFGNKTNEYAEKVLAAGRIQL